MGGAKCCCRKPQYSEELAKVKDEVVRRAVAQNPNTPIKLLEELAKD
jgi:pentose-5-phosphate-3-epimerase